MLLSASVTVAQGRLLEGRDPIALTAVQFLGATARRAAVRGGRGPAVRRIPAVAVLATLALTITGTLVPFSLFAFGQKRVSRGGGRARSSTWSRWSAPSSGSSPSATRPGSRQLGGGLAILAGIALSSLPLLALRRAPAPGRAATAVTERARSRDCRSGVWCPCPMSLRRARAA